MKYSSKLDDIAQEIKTCADCPLGSCRKRRVAGKIPDNIIHGAIILDYPSSMEARLTIPLADTIGEIVNSELAKNPETKKHIAILHCVKCCPKIGTIPSDHEISMCGYMKKQLDILQPRVILVTGMLSYKALFLHGDIIALPQEAEPIIERDRHTTMLSTYFESKEMVAVRITHSLRTEFEQEKNSIRKDVIQFIEICKSIER